MKKEEEKNRDVLSLLSVVISLITMIVLGINVLFNHYSVSISENEKEVVTNKNIIIDYVDNKQISLVNLIPGNYREYKIIISSKEDATSITNYTFKVITEESDFNSDFLRYTIKSNSSLKSDPGNMFAVEAIHFSETPEPTYTGSVKPGETQEYTFMIWHASDSTQKNNKYQGYFEITVNK